MNSPEDSTPAGVRLLAATIGVAAVLAMGALSVADISANELSSNRTSTQTTAPSTLATPFATRVITSTAAEG